MFTVRVKFHHDVWSQFFADCSPWILNFYAYLPNYLLQLTISRSQGPWVGVEMILKWLQLWSDSEVKIESELMNFRLTAESTVRGGVKFHHDSRVQWLESESVFTLNAFRFLPNSIRSVSTSKASCYFSVYTLLHIDLGIWNLACKCSRGSRCAFEEFQLFTSLTCFDSPEEVSFWAIFLNTLLNWVRRLKYGR